jgi:hypothetical protein
MQRINSTQSRYGVPIEKNSTLSRFRPESLQVTYKALSQL